MSEDIRALATILSVPSLIPLPSLVVKKAEAPSPNNWANANTKTVNGNTEPVAAFPLTPIYEVPIKI